jgi:hypothetical protein
VAEATLKDFLDGVAEAVMALEHAGAPIGEASKLTS